MKEYVYGTDGVEGHWLTNEEIVRCRDCEYYHDGTIKGRRYAEPHCLAIGELSCGALFEVDEDSFCSGGERREAEDDAQ